PRAKANPQSLQTNMTVTPVGNNAIGIDPLAVSLDFELNFGIFHLKWNPTIFDLGSLISPIRSDAEIPDEADRLRVGEYTELAPKSGSGTPSYSHLPQQSGGEFASMPESVAQCLAEQKKGGVEPTPKPSTPAPPAPPYG